MPFKRNYSIVCEHHRGAFDDDEPTCNTCLVQFYLLASPHSERDWTVRTFFFFFRFCVRLPINLEMNDFAILHIFDLMRINGRMNVDAIQLNSMLG